MTNTSVVNFPQQRMSLWLAGLQDSSVSVQSMLKREDISNDKRNKRCHPLIWEDLEDHFQMIWSPFSYRDKDYSQMEDNQENCFPRSGKPSNVISRSDCTNCIKPKSFNIKVKSIIATVLERFWTSMAHEACCHEKASSFLNRTWRQLFGLGYIRTELETCGTTIFGRISANASLQRPVFD